MTRDTPRKNNLVRGSIRRSARTDHVPLPTTLTHAPNIFNKKGNPEVRGGRRHAVAIGGNAGEAAAGVASPPSVACLLIATFVAAHFDNLTFCYPPTTPAPALCPSPSPPPPPPPFARLLLPTYTLLLSPLPAPCYPLHSGLLLLYPPSRFVVCRLPAAAALSTLMHTHAPRTPCSAVSPATPLHGGAPPVSTCCRIPPAA